MNKNLPGIKSILILILFIISNKELKAQITSCPGFTTYTQGGWGSNPKGNNPGSILENNFKNVFPFGLTIGSINKISFNSATAVRAFLPQGGTAKRLNPGTLINPTKANFSSVLAGQLVAATINLQMDRQVPSFGSSSTNLKDLKIAVAPFFNWTIEEVIAEANSFIGGKLSNYSANDFNTILTAINEGYDNGISSNTIFACPIVFSANSTNVKCTGESNGGISVSNIYGGAGAAYTYKINGYSVNLPINTLSTGVYTLEVFDRIGLSTKKTIVISEPSILVASSNANSILCNGGTTEVIVNATGGVPPYTGTGSFTVGAGTYMYTVTDANGCTAITNIEITQPEVLIASNVAGKILCNGGTTEVIVKATGGTGPYTGTGSFTVGAGNYQYTVTDANGCSSTTDIVITEPTAISISSTTTQDNSCNGGLASGTASVSVQGGVAPYTYTWSNGVTGTNILSNIAANTTLSVLVSDANGCSSNYTLSTITCEKNTIVECSSLKTFTQGGWGAVPNGNNPGVYLHANFSSAFPNGLVIGNASNNITLNSANAIMDFLPSGGSLNTLSGINTNPGGTISSTFAGQLVAATLNVRFDAFDSNFGTGSNTLSEMYCNFSGFYGVKVSDLLVEANQRIAGISTTHTSAALNSALTKLNENYDNGTINKGDFICELPEFFAVKSSNETDNSKDFEIYPNPASNFVNISINAIQNENAELAIYDISGQLLYHKYILLTEGINLVNLQLSELNLNTKTIVAELKFQSKIVKKILLLN